MKRFEGKKAHQPVNGIFQISFISIMIFLIFCGPGYGSTDIPVKVNMAPVAIEATALCTGFGCESDLINQEIITVVNGDIGTTAASTSVAGFDDTEAVYRKTLLDIETVNGTTHTAHPQCQDSCSF
jgi:hypothetical protein